MGNYRFRLSDMIPNAWFYKLKDMSKARNQNQPYPINKKPSLSTQDSRKPSYQNRESFYDSKAFDAQFSRDQPRKSSKKRSKRKAIYKSSSSEKNIPAVSAGFVFQESGIPVWLKPQMIQVEEYCTASPELDLVLTSPSSEFECSDSFAALHQSGHGGFESWSSSCSFKVRSSATDIILDMKELNCHAKKSEEVVKFDLISKPELPAILTTTPIKENCQQESPKYKNSHVEFKEEGRAQTERNSRTVDTRKSMSRSGSVKIKRNWARLASKKRENHGRKSMKIDKKGGGEFCSQSFAIVKASFDPENDFKNSMMEMIAENNIRASKDLEQLLACYLSLNTNQYHDLIIKAFEQIWFNMSELHL